ncbi:hypothetical protein C8J56DRAFT_799809, partial [Mycena floridula]
PISIANIDTLAKGKHYNSVAEYASDWHLMFQNCQTFNMDDSDIVQTANELEVIVDQCLQRLAEQEGLQYDMELSGTQITQIE